MTGADLCPLTWGRVRASLRTWMTYQIAGGRAVICGPLCFYWNWARPGWGLTWLRARAAWGPQLKLGRIMVRLNLGQPAN